MASPRPQVISLTDAAAARIKYVMANAAKPVVGVRVGVKNGGCAGMAYTMEYAEDVGKADEVVEDKGVRVLIDPKAVLFLLGTEMDYKTDKLSAQFVFNNPNQTSACGCGEILCSSSPQRPHRTEGHATFGAAAATSGSASQITRLRPRALGGIEAGVGALDQVLRRVARRAGGDADRDRSPARGARRSSASSVPWS